MSHFEKLIRHFERFPGIGGRQARRFAHHILTEDEEKRKELADLIRDIKTTVTECESCFRFYVRNGSGNICPICADTARDATQLTIVESDEDMLSIEKAGVYDGYYFVLGGLAPLLDSKDTQKLRGGALKHMAEKRSEEGLKEIILAFSVNPDGENTGRYVESLLKDLLEKNKIKVSKLGRGLSTGSELEYADPETIKNALKNRG